MKQTTLTQTHQSVSDTNYEYFTTITMTDYDERDKIVSIYKDHFSSDKYVAAYVVLEHGSYGTNPHLHAYVVCKISRSDNLTRSLKKIYPCSYTVGVTIKTKQCKDKIGLVGYYMQKEKQVGEEVVTKNVDIDTLITKYNQRKKTINNKFQKGIRLSFNELPDFYIQYCKSQGLPLTECAYSDNLVLMIRDRMIPLSFQGKLKVLYVALACILDWDVKRQAVAQQCKLEIY